MCIANAKINLTLDVSDKRSDGFHGIDSVFCTVSLSDEVYVTAKKADRLEIRLICDDPALPTDGKNLCVKAAEIFAKKVGFPFYAEITLKKNIPYGAGLGGGSSDAALSEAAAAVGSDMPFFLCGGAARVEGRGESVNTLSLSAKKRIFVLIAKPDFHANTGEMYSLLDRREKMPPVTEVFLKKAEEDLISALPL